MDISYKTQKKIIIVTFLFLPMVLFFIFHVIPFFDMLRLSISDATSILSMDNAKIIGFDNYIRSFVYPEVWLSFRNNLYYMAGSIIQNILALMLALIIFSRLKAKNFFKSSIFLPYMINSAAIAFIFSFLYSYNGSINKVLMDLGMGPVRFLSDPKLVNISLVGASMWRWLGFTTVIYFTALQSVPKEIYESAVVDGANARQTLWHITLPNIKRMVELSLFLGMAGALKAFTEPFILTSGGPNYASSTFLVYVMNSAFRYDDIGLATAMSVELAIIVLIYTLLQRFIFRKN